MRRALHIVLLLAMLSAIALLALQSADWNEARGWIGRKVEERTGRALVIAGDLRVHPWSLHPRIRAEQVTFANAEWGEKRPMLQAEAIEFSVSLLSLLSGGGVNIPELTLSGADLLLVDRQR